MFPLQSRGRKVDFPVWEAGGGVPSHSLSVPFQPSAGWPRPPPPGREAMCSARSTDSHVSRIRETLAETPRAVCGPAPGHLVAQPRSQYNHPLQRPWGKCSPRGPARGTAPPRRARGSSDSAAPKHRRRRRESGKPSLSGRSARAQRGGVREAIGLSRLLCCSQRQVRCRSAPE